MQIEIKNLKEKLAGTLVFPIIKDKKLAKKLATIAKFSGVNPENLSSDFSGNSKEILSYYDPTGRTIYLLGLGENPDTNNIIQTCRSFIHHRKNILPAHIGLDTELTQSASLSEYILNGFLLGCYNINLYQTDKKEIPALISKKAKISVYAKKAAVAKIEIAVNRASKIAATQQEIFDLINKPSNKKIPQDLANWAVKSGKENGFSVRVMEKPEIEKEGLHGLLAVNRGSEHPARFIIMEYKPKTKKKVKQIGIVGKGVTFDTGGLSIKGSSNMHLMKSDMGGAGAVFGTIELAAKLQLPIHLIAIVPTTDNSVDALSIKPSDVIGSYSGKTIEIIDTDAEGRLILADGVSYLNKNFKPEVLIDVATLTGSVIRSLGYFAAGLFTNNEDLAEELITAGKETGERLWQMPMWEDYGSYIKSDVADVRNYSGRPIAGSITAAKFIEHFIGNHPKWAHLDIAGTAVTANEFATDRSATGFGVRLLLQLLENYSNK